jgi:putative component of membrane protein insertase Oxa1/YidC/SpoIIIJ protein YidD
MRYAVLVLIRLYKILSAPLHFFVRFFGVEVNCKYPISCSDFAAHEIQFNHSIFVALCNIFKRFISCGPWSAFFIRN